MMYNFLGSVSGWPLLAIWLWAEKRDWRIIAVAPAAENGKALMRPLDSRSGLFSSVSALCSTVWLADLRAPARAVFPKGNLNSYVQAPT